MKTLQPILRVRRANAAVRRKSRALRVLFWASVLVGMGPTPHAMSEPAPMMPRYRLGVGSALFYETHSEYGGGDTVLSSDGTNTIFVVGQETNGTWNMALMGESFVSNPDGELLRVDQVLNLFNLSPGGKVLDVDEALESDAQRNCFLALPGHTDDVLTSWTETWGDRLETHAYQYHAASEPERGKWIFIRAESGLQKTFFGLERTASILFNTPVGLVDRMESRFEQRVGDKVMLGAEISQLRRADILFSPFLKALIGDLRVYKQARMDYSVYMEALWKSDREPVDILAEAALILRKATREVTRPDVKAAIERELARHYDQRQNALDRASVWRPMIGKALPSLETETLAGEPFTLGSLEGKVTVLHFWSKDSVLSLRGVAKLEQLAAGFTGQPLALLGANLDNSVSDAREVEKFLRPKRASVKGAAFLREFGQSRLPLILVIDKKGILRDVRFDARAYDRASLTTRINALLSS